MTIAAGARYTPEFMQELVRLVEGRQSIATGAHTLGEVEQTLFDWVKVQRQDQPKGAELARLKIERDNLGKAMAN